MTEIASCWTMAKPAGVRKPFPIPSSASGSDGPSCQEIPRWKRRSFTKMTQNPAQSVTRPLCRIQTGPSTVLTVPELSVDLRKLPASASADQTWTVRRSESLYLQALQTSNAGYLRETYSYPRKTRSNRPPAILYLPPKADYAKIKEGSHIAEPVNLDNGKSAKSTVRTCDIVPAGNITLVFSQTEQSGLREEIAEMLLAAHLRMQRSDKDE